MIEYSLFSAVDLPIARVHISPTVSVDFLDDPARAVLITFATEVFFFFALGSLYDCVDLQVLHITLSGSVADFIVTMMCARINLHFEQFERISFPTPIAADIMNLLKKGIEQEYRKWTIL